MHSGAVISMSAFGPKQTSPLSCTCPLSGVKRTCRVALMSAFDPKRTTLSKCYALYVLCVHAGDGSQPVFWPQLVSGSLVNKSRPRIEWRGPSFCHQLAN
jgi:hypothetical protein